MYCKYCGRKLGENEVCSCWKSLNFAESSEESASPEQPQQEEEFEDQKTEDWVNDPTLWDIDDSENSKSGMTDVGGAIRSIPGMFTKFCSEPFSELERLYKKTDKIPQYCLGAIYLILWFIFSLTLFLRCGFGGSSVGYAFLILILAAVCRAAFACGSYLLSGRQCSILDSLSLFCANTAYESICLAVMFIVALIWGLNSFTVVLILFLMMLIIGTICNYNAARVVCPERQGFLLLIILSLVLAFVITLILQQAWTDLVFLALIYVY